MAAQGTVFTPSLEGMKHVKCDNGQLLTKPFLERLENKYLSDPTKYSQLYTMVQEEVAAEKRII